MWHTRGHNTVGANNLVAIARVATTCLSTISTLAAVRGHTVASCLEPGTTRAPLAVFASSLASLVSSTQPIIARSVTPITSRAQTDVGRLLIVGSNPSSPARRRPPSSTRSTIIFHIIAPLQIAGSGSEGSAEGSPVRQIGTPIS